MLVSRGCRTGTEDSDSLYRLRLDWGPQAPDGTQEARISRDDSEVGTLLVHSPAATARLWQLVRRVLNPGPAGFDPADEPRRHAVLRLSGLQEPRLPDVWNILLTPAWRTAEGTTMAVAKLPVPCPRCIESHGGGICALLPLSGGLQP